MLAAVLVMALLAALSAGAYLVARSVIYGRLYERLESAPATARSTDAQQPFVLQAGSAPPSLRHAGEAVADTDDFTVAVLPHYGTLAILRRASPNGEVTFLALRASEERRALQTFAAILGGLIFAGGGLSLPAGYLLAGRALLPLDEAVRERTEFVALASHRLRTPLAVIRTSAELALAGQGVEPHEALGTIIAQTAAMEGIAGRMTALARAESRPNTPRPAADLAAVAGRVVADLRPAARQRGVELRWLPAALAPVACAPADVEDALVSVLENAVRFSPPGEVVEVRLRRLGHRRAALEVEDRGPGIDPGDLPRVTRPFYQGSRAQGGTGLGLAVARAAAERHGGILDIASPPGGGTLVRLVWPLCRAGGGRP